MNGFGNSSFLGKELGPVTVGQILSMAIASIAGLGLLFWKSSGMIIPLCLVVAIIAYMLPHVFGATPKVKVGYLLVLLVAVILVGTFAVGPACINDHSDKYMSKNNGISYKVDVVGDQFTFTITEDASGVTTDYAVAYVEVGYVAFENIYLSKGNLSDVDYETFTGSSKMIILNTHKIYNVFIAHVDGEGKIDSETMSYSTLTGFGYDGSYTSYTMIGAAYVAAYIALFFFIILGITTVMRNRLKHARAKMEAEGRLYPQGYGRCTFCGALVLPGEVNCRKCGAYIDRPESMKPHKKNYLTCSACGAEITEDMTVCPKCGASFEGEESIVTHMDGTQESTSEMMVCPVCSKHIPAASERCMYCGKKFDE